MNRKLNQVVRRVLSAAADTPQFFELSEAQRLSVVIADAYIRGQLSACRAASDQIKRSLAEDEEKQ